MEVAANTDVNVCINGLLSSSRVHRLLQPTYLTALMGFWALLRETQSSLFQAQALVTSNPMIPPLHYSGLYFLTSISPQLGLYLRIYRTHRQCPPYTGYVMFLPFLVVVLQG